MFGFLKPRAGMCCRDRNALQEHLCAACHGMAGFGGRVSAVLANYDATFWLVVASALCGAGAPVGRRCTAVPFRTVSVASAPPRVARVMAAMNVLLLAAKLRDDAADGEGLLRRAAGVALGPWARKARRELRDCGFPVQAIDGLPEAQALVERDCRSLEALEAPTAACMAACFGFIGRSWEAELRALGAALGRLLYLWDAVTDFDEDARRGRFNALAACGLAPGDVSGRVREHLRALEEALAALPLGERRGLVAGVVGGLRREIGPAAVRPADDCCPSCDCDCDSCCCCLDSCDCCDDCCPDNPCKRRKGPPGARAQCDDCGCGSCCSCEGCSCEGCEGCGCSRCCVQCAVDQACSACCTWDPTCCCYSASSSGPAVTPSPAPAPEPSSTVRAPVLAPPGVWEDQVQQEAHHAHDQGAHEGGPEPLDPEAHVEGPPHEPR